MDASTRREIDKVVWQTLKDAGIYEPPVNVALILEHLHLYSHYYNLKDPGFLDRAKYKLQVNGQRLVDVLRKVSLKAVLLYDESRVVLDSGLPVIKHDWSFCHEATHRILEWHRPYFYGDTAETLDPSWQESLETEANFGASALMFCGPVFSQEAKDTTPEWASVNLMKGRYKKSTTTTLRRYVEHGPDLPMAMLASTGLWQEQPADQPERWRQFAYSPAFAAQFSAATPEELLASVDHHAKPRRGGPVADYTFQIEDDNGQDHEFRAESFNNTHYLLTLFVHRRRMAATKVFVPRRITCPQ